RKRHAKADTSAAARLRLIGRLPASPDRNEGRAPTTNDGCCSHGSCDHFPTWQFPAPALNHVFCALTRSSKFASTCCTKSALNAFPRVSYSLAQLATRCAGRLPETFGSAKYSNCPSFEILPQPIAMQSVV